jgi:hypothetical protein
MPMEAIPGPNSIVLTYNDIRSNIGGTSATTGLGPGPDRMITTTIYAK